MPDSLQVVWDAFICHASEDKEAFVRPLAVVLRQEGVTVWFDEFEIAIGDSIASKIEVGLANSRVGVVVISEAFLAKGWPTYELNTFKHLRIVGTTRLIPVFHGVDVSKVRTALPGLLDIKGIEATGRSVAECACEILAAVRPDLAARMHMKRAYQRVESVGRTEMVAPSQIAHGIKRRDKLPERDVSRLAVLQSCFADIFEDGLEGWIQDFFCDVNYEREIRIWERMAACYLRCTAGKHYTRSVRRDVFALLLAYFSGADHSHIEAKIATLPKGIRSRCTNAIVGWAKDWKAARPHILENELADNVEVQNLIDQMQQG